MPSSAFWSASHCYDGVHSIPDFLSKTSDLPFCWNYRDAAASHASFLLCLIIWTTNNTKEFFRRNQMDIKWVNRIELILGSVLYKHICTADWHISFVVSWIADPLHYKYIVRKPLFHSLWRSLLLDHGVLTWLPNSTLYSLAISTDHRNCNSYCQCFTIS